MEDVKSVSLGREGREIFVISAISLEVEITIVVNNETEALALHTYLL